MYPGVTNQYARYALTGLDILMGLAMATLSIFSIYFWGRAIYRMVNKQDWISGRKEEIIVEPIFERTGTTH